MKTITVKGIGQLSVKPDFITISLDIQSLEKEYPQAMRKAADRISRLEDAAVRAGFEKSDLKTTKFQVSTNYENKRKPDGEYKSVFSGYLCSYALKLSFDFNPQVLSDLLSAIAESHADPELHISFTVKDPAAVNEALLQRAAENAKEKAEILCKASGVSLGSLVSIDYNWGELLLESRTRYEIEDSLQSVGACYNARIEPDDIEVSDTAAFVWEIC